MSGDLQAATGQFKPGMNSRKLKQLKTAARLEELRAEFDPGGTASVLDRHRLELAAMHYIIAETARDPTVSVRSTRTAEYLLNKIRPSPSPPRLPAADDPAALALEHLRNGKSPGVV
jgi:hypothetical protein